VNWDHRKGIPDGFARLEREGLLIAFDGRVRSGDIDERSFVVLAGTRDERTQLICWCQIPWRRVGGIELDLGPGPAEGTCRINRVLNEPANPDVRVNGAQYLPDINALRRLQEINQGWIELRIALKGDLVADAPASPGDERGGHGVDANHLPPWLPQRPTGEGVEGSTFESWFTLSEG
jgi:hypothetical protein